MVDYKVYVGSKFEARRAEETKAIKLADKLAEENPGKVIKVEERKNKNTTCIYTAVVTKYT